MEQKSQLIEHIEVQVGVDASRKKPKSIQMIHDQPRTQKNSNKNLNVSDRPTADTQSTRKTQPVQTQFMPQSQTLKIQNCDFNDDQNYMQEYEQNLHFNNIKLQGIGAQRNHTHKKAVTEMFSPQSQSGTNSPTSGAVQNRSPKRKQVTLPSINGGTSPQMVKKNNYNNSSMSSSNDNYQNFANEADRAQEAVHHILRKSKNGSQSPLQRGKYQSNTSKFQHEFSINSSLNYSTINIKAGGYQAPKVGDEVRQSMFPSPLKNAELYRHYQEAYNIPQPGMQSDLAFYQQQPPKGKHDSRSRAIISPMKNKSQLVANQAQKLTKHDDRLKLPQSIVKQLQKSLNTQDFTNKKGEDATKSDKRNQPSIILKNIDQRQQQSGVNHGHSFDVKKGGKNSERDLTAEILDSMNLNIEQILQERPGPALRIEENLGTNSNEDYVMHAIKFERQAGLMSQLKNHPSPQQKELAINGVVNLETHSLPNVAPSKLTDKQLEFRNNMKCTAVDELINQRQFLYSTQQLPAASLEKSESESDESPKMRKAKQRQPMEAHTHGHIQEPRESQDPQESTQMSRSVEVCQKVKKTINFSSTRQQVKMAPSQECTLDQNPIRVQFLQEPQGTVSPRGVSLVSPNPYYAHNSSPNSPTKVRPKQPKKDKQQLRNLSKNNQQKKQHVNPSYFQTFQMNEVAGEDYHQGHQQKDRSVDFEQFYVFNNFSYSNIPNQQPGQLFGSGQNPVEKQNRQIFQAPNILTSQNAAGKQKQLRVNFPAQLSSKVLPKFQSGGVNLGPNSPENKPNPNKYQFPVIEASVNGGIAPLKQANTSEKAADQAPSSNISSKRNSQTYYGKKLVQLQQPMGYMHKSPQQLLSDRHQEMVQTDMLGPIVDQNAGIQLYHKFLLENQREACEESERHVAKQKLKEVQNSLNAMQIQTSRPSAYNSVIQNQFIGNSSKGSYPMSLYDKIEGMNYIKNVGRDHGLSHLERQGQYLRPQQQGVGIMVQGMSKERTLKAQKQLLLQKQVQYLLQQKHLQEEFQKSFINNYSNFQVNKYQMTLRDFEECIQRNQVERLPFNEHRNDEKSEVKRIEPVERPSPSPVKKEKELESPIKRVPLNKYKNYTLKAGKSSFWNQPQEIPPTKITIHHEFDQSLHFNHKLNVAIRNINAVIRLIFKNTKDHSAITAVSPGTTIHQTKTLIDENRLREIQKIANAMKVGIPRRFDSKTAIREFIQTREFISAMKQSMSYQLFTCINNTNNILPLVRAKQDKIAKLYDKKEYLKQQEKELSKKVDQATKGDGNSPKKRDRLDKKSKLPTLGTQAQSDAVSQDKSHASEKRDGEDEQEKTPVKMSKKKEKKQLMLQKQREEEQYWENELNEELEKEALRREEEEEEPMVKADRLKIEQMLIEKRDKLKEKEKLLQFTQKYYIGPGNNYQVVRQAIKSRYWWTPAPTEDFTEANFIWTSWKRDKHIDFLKQKGQNEIDQPLKIYGRMDNNKQLTNKKGVFINMREYYQAMGIDPFTILPQTYLIKNCNDAEFGQFAQQYEAINRTIKERSQRQRAEINKHLKNKKNTKKQKNQDSDYEDEQFEQDDDEIKQIKKKWNVPVNSWIVKPGENTNRGVGISVTQDINEIRSLIASSSGRSGQESTHIIQKYIDYPLLIHKRKFDFRVFALVTSINKTLKGYFYEDGYIRTSSKEFDLNNLGDKFIHLTNDAIQKQADDFGKFENCNKMSYGDFQRYLNQFHADLEVDVVKHIVPQMKRLITDTFRATCYKLDPNRLLNSFEMLGYDFMIDQNFKLSLIEVNTNPCLETESPLLARIIPELIENTFKIVLDPIFPSPDLSTNRKQFVNEIPQEIKYSLIFDEEIDGQEVRRTLQAFQQKQIDEEEAIQTRDQNCNQDTKTPGNRQKLVEIESDKEEDLCDCD